MHSQNMFLDNLVIFGCQRLMCVCVPSIFALSKRCQPFEFTSSFSWGRRAQPWQEQQSAGHLPSQRDPLHPQHLHGAASGGCAAGSQPGRGMHRERQQGSQPVEQREDLQGASSLPSLTLQEVSNLPLAEVFFFFFSVEENEWTAHCGSETGQFWQWVGGRNDNIQEPGGYVRTREPRSTSGTQSFPSQELNNKTPEHLRWGKKPRLKRWQIAQRHWLSVRGCRLV